jgi:hypothetical protein
MRQAEGSQRSFYFRSFSADHMIFCTNITPLCSLLSVSEEKLKIKAKRKKKHKTRKAIN